MIKKFWLGQTPMWINVWILGLVFFRLLIIGSFFGIDYLKSELGVSISFNMLVLALLPIYLFWGIATWRSSQIYKGRKLWSLLTKLFVVIKCGGHISALFIGANFLL